MAFVHTSRNVCETDWMSSIENNVAIENVGAVYAFRPMYPFFQTIGELRSRIESQEDCVSAITRMLSSRPSVFNRGVGSNSDVVSPKKCGNDPRVPLGMGEDCGRLTRRMTITNPRLMDHNYPHRPRKSYSIRLLTRDTWGW